MGPHMLWVSSDLIHASWDSLKLQERAHKRITLHVKQTKQSRWYVVCGILELKTYCKTKFQVTWTCSFGIKMAIFPWFFDHFEDFLFLSLFLHFSTHILPYLRKYCSDWTEVFCEISFGPRDATHYIFIPGWRRPKILGGLCDVQSDSLMCVVLYMNSSQSRW